MKIGAIVCEYNPFHNGHEYHLRKTKELGVTHVISIMSGDFVQRGEAAILSKYARTKMALLNGADLVLELPTMYSMTTAELFAQSAISVANAIGCVNVVSFGCESANVGMLYEICDFLETTYCSSELRKKLSTGITFARARSETVRESLGLQYSKILENPNDILAIEYVKAMRKMSMSAEILAVPRKSVEHDSSVTFGNFASASHIRNLIRSGDDSYKDFVPKNVIPVIEDEVSMGRAPADIKSIERAILCSLRKIHFEEFRKVPDVREGLENKIFSAIKKSTNLNDLIWNIKSKRYTHSRIRRIIVNAFLDIKSGDVPKNPPYVRVLGVSEGGKQILRVAKKQSSLPVISRVSQLKNLDEFARKVFEKQVVCSNLYSMCFPVPGVCQEDYTSKLIVL